MAANVQAVYKFVMDEVVKSVRDDFNNEGIEESVLDELQQLWESKLAHVNVLNMTNDASASGYPYHDGSYAAQTPVAHYPTGAQVASAAQLASLATSNVRHPNDREYDGYGKPKQYLPQSKVGAAPQTRPPQNTRYPPQHDGADDLTPSEADAEIERQLNETAIEFTISDPSERRKKSSREVRQFDGEGDSEEEEGNDNGDENLSNGSSDDDGDDENEVTDMVLCLYDKVTRAKNKWRCSLRDGVMHINGRDYVFSKATGELEW